MVSEVVWIYGSSAVGKETFIRYLDSEPSGDLIERLGWIGKKLAVVWESISGVIQHKVDSYESEPIGDRKYIVERVLEIGDEVDVVLIKGQDIDIVNGLPQLLRERLPDCRHRIIHLYTDIGVVYERCKKKAWWKGNEVSLEEFKGWLRYQIELLSGLDGFEIMGINNGDDKYLEVGFPPRF